MPFQPFDYSAIRTNVNQSEPTLRTADAWNDPSKSSYLDAAATRGQTFLSQNLPAFADYLRGMFPTANRDALLNVAQQNELNFFNRDVYQPGNYQVTQQDLKGYYGNPPVSDPSLVGVQGVGVKMHNPALTNDQAMALGGYGGGGAGAVAAFQKEYPGTYLSPQAVSQMYGLQTNAAIQQQQNSINQFVSGHYLQAPTVASSQPVQQQGSQYTAQQQQQQQQYQNLLAGYNQQAGMFGNASQPGLMGSGLGNLTPGLYPSGSAYAQMLQQSGGGSPYGGGQGNPFGQTNPW